MCIWETSVLFYACKQDMVGSGSVCFLIKDGVPCILPFKESYFSSWEFEILPNLSSANMYLCTEWERFCPLPNLYIGSTWVGKTWMLHGAYYHSYDCMLSLEITCVCLQVPAVLVLYCMRWSAVAKTVALEWCRCA